MQSCNSHHPDEMFNAVYKQYRRFDSYYAYRLLRDVEEAKDISANSFVSLWKERNSFPSTRHMTSYVRTCTLNACLNRLKLNERCELWHQEVLQRYYLPDTYEMRDVFAESGDAALNRIIQSLDMKYQGCIRLFYFNKMTCSQIAAALNLTERNVKYFLKVGRSLIKSAISSN